VTDPKLTCVLHRLLRNRNRQKGYLIVANNKKAVDVGGIDALFVGGSMLDKNLVSMGSSSFEDLKK